jgi:NADPH-dependent 2,4-dienoyl-CoA reductase/sulfur reductase-like enzyme
VPSQPGQPGQPGRPDQPGHIVIVGASLAGLEGARALRDEGFTGALTIVGDEQEPPYDRPPLSKVVLSGWVPADHTFLPRLPPNGTSGSWRLGNPAARLDQANREVVLADGTRIPYDKVLIATGVRNVSWPDHEQARLAGVLGVRTQKDAAGLARLLAAGPGRVVVVGGGFTGSEIASGCRHRDIPVTVIERGEAPLAGALGGVIGDIAADLQRSNGVDLRTGTTVEALEGSGGQLRAVTLSTGETIEADVTVLALGAVRNVEWLADSGLAVSPLGVATDAGCRAIGVNGLVTDDIFVAGDVSRFTHPLFGYEFLALEHWENAVVGARVAAHNMICAPHERRPHVCVPTFWSTQFDVNIKSVGVPPLASEIVITQGSPQAGSFAAAYGSEQGRIVAAVTFNHGRYLDYYRQLIERAAPLPGPVTAGHSKPQPARFPHPAAPAYPYHGPTVVVTGHSPTEMDAVRVTGMPAGRSAQ